MNSVVAFSRTPSWPVPAFIRPEPTDSTADDPRSKNVRLSINKYGGARKKVWGEWGAPRSTQMRVTTSTAGRIKTGWEVATRVTKRVCSGRNDHKASASGAGPSGLAGGVAFWRLTSAESSG